MRRYKFYFFIISIWLLIESYGYAQKAIYVGIPNSRMSFFASVQQKPQWCWAASIQMVMKYYDVDIDQQQIVKRTYGNANGELPDWAASIQTIHNNLNYKGIDNKGRRYIVNAQVGYGAPEANVLIGELSHKRPVVIGYKANFGGHVVLITAVSYYETSKGPIIRSIVVRDPMPEINNQFDNGRVEYEGATLADRIDAYWLVRVLADGDN